MCGGGKSPPPAPPPPAPAQVPVAQVAEGPAGPFGMGQRAAGGAPGTMGALETKTPSVKSLLGA